MADGLSALSPGGGKLFATPTAAGFQPYGSKTQDPNNLFGGPQAASGIDPAMKAGYYRMPGTDQAVYVDPASGSVPQEVVSGGLSSKDLVGGDPQAVFQSTQSQSPDFLASMDKASGLLNSGLSPQQAQDQLIGAGTAQKFAIGTDGKPVNMAAVDAKIAEQNNPGYQPPTPEYHDISNDNAIVGAAPKPPQSGLSSWSLDNQNATAALTSAKGRGVVANEVAHGRFDMAARMLANNQAADALNVYNQKTANSVASSNIKGGGDWQGMSAGKTADQSAIYNSIQTPEGKASWLAAQDPANLTPELRAAHDAALASENAIYSPGVNDKWSATTTQIADQLSGKDLAGYNGQFMVKYGDVAQTDAATGRKTIYGNVPKAMRFDAHSYTDWQRGLHGLAGGVMAGMTSGFNPYATALGAYSGAGGYMPTKGFKSGIKDWKANKNPTTYTSTQLFTQFGLGAGLGTYAKAGQAAAAAKYSGMSGW